MCLCSLSIFVCPSGLSFSSGVVFMFCFAFVCPFCFLLVYGISVSLFALWDISVPLPALCCCVICLFLCLCEAFLLVCGKSEFVCSVCAIWCFYLYASSIKVLHNLLQGHTGHMVRLNTQTLAVWKTNTTRKKALSKHQESFFSPLRKQKSQCTL